MGVDRFEVFPGKVSGWYWRLVSCNNRTLCVSECYTRKRDAIRAVHRARVTADTAVLRIWSDK